MAPRNRGSFYRPRGSLPTTAVFPVFSHAHGVSSSLPVAHLLSAAGVLRYHAEVVCRSPVARHLSRTKPSRGRRSAMLRKPLITTLVILFWAVSTGWLVTQKIAPLLFTGDPPASYFVPEERTAPVAWTVLWNDEVVGWSLSECTPRQPASQGWRLNTRLRLDDLPLEEILPDWVQRIAGHTLSTELPLILDTTGELWLDAEGHLEEFESKVYLPELGQRVVIRGTVEGENVEVTVRSREFVYETTRALPDTGMLGDELSPQAMLPGLTVGRRWTVPVYNPLGFTGSPLSVLHAHVEGAVTLFWEDRIVRPLLVAYRDDPAAYKEPRAQLWVDRDGRVLQQQSKILGSTLTFLRRTDDDARILAGTVPPVASGRPGSGIKGTP